MSTTTTHRASDPPGERERSALRLGQAAVVMGGSMLALAFAAVVWVLGLHSRTASGGHWGGIASTAWFMVVLAVVPGVVVLTTLAALYVRAGRRAYQHGRRTRGLWITGLTSAALAVTTAAIALAVEAGSLGTSVSGLFGAWRELSVALFVVLGAHGVTTIVLGRPCATSRRSAAGWLFVGASGVALGAALILRGGADQWLDGPPLPGMAASVTRFGGLPHALALSGDGTRLAAANGGRITFFDVPADRELWTTHLRDAAWRGTSDPPSLAISPDGSTLLYAAHETFAVLDTSRGEVLYRPTCGPGVAPTGTRPEQSGTFARGGAALILSGASLSEREDGQVCILDTATGTVQSTIARACTSLTATEKGDRVWGLCNGGHPTAFDAVTGAELQRLDTVAFALALFPDDTRIITAISSLGAPGPVKIHDTATGARLLEFTIAEGSETIIGPLRGGESWLIAGGHRLFEVDLPTRRVTRVLCDDLRAAASAAGTVVTASATCHPDGRYLWLRDVSR